jgi:predicted nucleotidyltransferase
MSQIYNGLTRDDIILTVNNFIRVNFDDCLAACITGSCLTKNFKNKSDIDVIIISKNVDKTISETFSGYRPEIHAIILPENKLGEILLEDWKRREGICLHMLTNCFILKDTNKILEDLRDSSFDLFSKGPPLLSSNEIHNFRVRIDSLVSDLNGGLNFDQMIFVSSRILTLLVELNIGWHKKWLFRNKHAPEALREVDNVLMNDIVRSLKVLYAQENCKEFISVVSKNLNLFNSNCSKHSTGRILKETQINQFVFAISGPSNVIEFYKQIIYPFLWTKSFTDYFLFQNSDPFYAGVTYFLIIKDAQYVINTSIIDLLNTINRENVWLIEYPYNYIPVVSGIPAICTPAEDFFCFASKELVNIIQGRLIWSQDEAFEYAFLFFINYFSVYKVGKDKVVALCKYLYEVWESKWEDTQKFMDHGGPTKERIFRNRMLSLEFERNKAEFFAKYFDKTKANGTKYKDESSNVWHATIMHVAKLCLFEQNEKLGGVIPSYINKFTSNRKWQSDFLIHKYILDMFLDILFFNIENKVYFAYFLVKIYSEPDFH